MDIDYPSILLIGQEPTLTRAVARCLRLAGCLPVVLAPSACWPMKLGRDCRSLLFWSTAQTPADQIRQLCAGAGIEKVLAADADTTLLLARHPDIPACPTPSAALIATLRDRWNLARFAVAAGLPKPPSLRAESAAQLQGDPLLYPIITRPLTGGGVRVHRKRRALPAAFPLLAQVYVPGWDASATFLAEHGRISACTIFRMTRRGRPVLHRSRRLREYVEQFVDASSYHGMGHLGWRYDPSRDAYYLLSWRPGFDLTLPAALRAGVNYPGRILLK